MTNFQLVLKCLLCIVFGSMSIMFAIDDYHRGRYFMCGWNLMFTVVFIVIMVKMMLGV